MFRKEKVRGAETVSRGEGARKKAETPRSRPRGHRVIASRGKQEDNDSSSPASPGSTEARHAPLTESTSTPPSTDACNV